MRFVIALISIIIVLSCSTTRSLNLAINSNQNDCIQSSSFKSARSISNELQRQLSYRKDYIATLQDLKLKFPNDTLILKENYDYICIGCPADYVAIYVDSLLCSYRLEDHHTEYTKQELKILQNFSDKDGYFYDDFSELIQEIRTNSKWYTNPEKFGTDYCFDGGHTLYTVIFPSGKIESMYMRCWIPKDFREKK
jgi:hypothetical protein